MLILDDLRYDFGRGACSAQPFWVGLSMVFRARGRAGRQGPWCKCPEAIAKNRPALRWARLGEWSCRRSATFCIFLESSRPPILGSRQRRLARNLFQPVGRFAAHRL